MSNTPLSNIRTYRYLRFTIRHTPRDPLRPASTDPLPSQISEFVFSNMNPTGHTN